MALDTATKRASALGVGMPPGIILPVPDGTIDAADRAALSGVVVPTAAVPGSFTAVSFKDGLAYDDDGAMGTIFLGDAEPVPTADARYIERGLARSAAGMRYVCAWPVSGVVFYEGKIARRADGAMCIAAAGTPVEYKSGWALTARGEVLASTSAPELVKDGVGLRQNGFVCMSEIA